jgi:NADH:ubiquinone oxidoreductase subunit 2 (subunit N)
VTGVPAQENLWTIALAVMVCISLAWGNLGALVQTDVKRMLAYSEHLACGLPAHANRRVPSPLGGRALMYYLFAYAAMSIAPSRSSRREERELAAPVTPRWHGGLGWERPGLGAR